MLATCQEYYVVNLVPTAPDPWPSLARIDYMHVQQLVANLEATYLLTDQQWANKH